MSVVIKRIWLLMMLCIKGPGGKMALLYGLIVLALNLVEIQVGLKMITWNKEFYDALGKYDTQAAIWQIGVFAILTAMSTLLFVSTTYIRQLMQIRWRTTLTQTALDKWMHNKAYWFLNTPDSSVLDNPDQRIAEDCRIFVEKLTGKALDLLTGIIGLVTYVILLWNLSAFSISFTLFGTPFVIEHYIIWIAPVYVLFCSGLTHWLGAALMKLNIIKNRREADLRFSLTRFRESKEAIALENGEAVERQTIDKRYGLVVDNWRSRINREFVLNSFTRPYMFSVLYLPLFVAFPAYLAKHVALGGLMELSKAFQKVVLSLSWFILSYKDLAELAASSSRLAIFFDAAEKVTEKKQSPIIGKSADGTLHIKDLRIQDPQGKELLELSELNVKPGEVVWVEGPSGMGKSTLFKTIAGLWPHCSGSIELPSGSKLFLPQKAYMPLGNLGASVSYPISGHATDDEIETIRSLLYKVGLKENTYLEQLGDTSAQGTSHNFSGGEQQRLMIARILYTKPDWVFLDEATSALDAQAEKELYTLLRESLPNSAFVVIAHRKPNGLGELRHVSLISTNTTPN